MKKARGFTLLELLITITIAAILTAVAIPSFEGIIRNNRALTNANDFLTALMFTRNEAIKQGLASRVVICPGTETGCSGTTWKNGWVIFVDNDRDAQFNGNDVLLRTHEGLSGEDDLTVNFAGMSTYISYTPDGSARMVGAVGIIQMGTMQFSLVNTRCEVYQIVINARGRARVVKQIVSAHDCG